MAIWIQASTAQERTAFKRLLLLLAICVNLSLLLYFKYTNFFIDNLNALLSLLGKPDIPMLSIVMPIGISFFTFQSMSYVIDVYRGQVAVQKNFMNLALYVSFFPQLIAGPIVRYIDIENEINNRQETFLLVVEGIRRFIIGFGKKIIIANTVAEIADNIFSLPMINLSTSVAWIGILCYTLQIYFDFSGYSDMAIGLGKIFGFNFLENFNYPYISSSITEFWRRWHISLSSWFRDYVYIPLGGNRKGTVRTYINAFIVFFITGFWHGASWNFIVWGLFHGIFLSIEKSDVIDKTCLLFHINTRHKVMKILSHLFTLGIVMVGWVFFRADSLGDAKEYILRMLMLTNPDYVLFTYGYYINGFTTVIIFIALIISTPIYPWLFTQYHFKLSMQNTIGLLRDAVLLAVFVFSAMSLAASAYNPFIYFRF